jgi:hypothetical protein
MESITQETQDILQLLSTQFQQIYRHYSSIWTHANRTNNHKGIYVMGMEAFICIYGKLLFPKQYVHPFFGEPENNLLSLER